MSDEVVAVKDEDLFSAEDLELLRPEQKSFVRHVAANGHRAVLYDDNPAASPRIDNPAADPRIDFASPKTGTYRMVFVLCQDTLFVTGDVGCAAYRWTGSINWIGLRSPGHWNSDFRYFHGKCEASREGARPYDWNETQAEARAAELLADAVKTVTEDEGEDSELLPRLRDLETEMPVSTRIDWEDWVKDLDSELSVALFGEEYYDYFNIGNVPSQQCWLHWKGLQIALDQLDAQNRLRK